MPPSNEQRSTFAAIVTAPIALLDLARMLPELVGGLRSLLAQAGRLGDLRDRLFALTDDDGSLARLDERLAAVDESLSRVAAIEERLARLGAVEGRVAGLEATRERVAGVAASLERLAESTESLPALDEAAAALPDLQARVRAVEERVVSTNKQLRALQPTLERLAASIAELEGSVGSLGRDAAAKAAERPGRRRWFGSQAAGT